MKTLLKSYIADAILLMILGIILLVRPAGTLEFICTLFGIILLVMGAIKLLVFFFKKDGAERSTASLLVAILQLIFGILLIACKGFFIGFFPFVAGVIIGYGAIVSLITALRLRKFHLPGNTVAIALSVITLVLAILVIAHPAVISEIIVQLIGISMLVEGVTLLVALSRRRK